MAQAAEKIAAIRVSLPAGVSLLAVSKYQSVDAIRDAYSVGQRDFGESHVQELRQKIDALSTDCPDIRWHFIGHLQTNKVRDLLRCDVALIQSVDSEHLMATLEKEAALQLKEVRILLEVHVAREESKSGFTPEQLHSLDLSRYPHLHVQGVMGMASHTEDPEEIRRCFEAIRKASRALPGTTVSMGMSSDYPIAIECGSTMVRIGSAIFGVRG